mgnify:CR=1 FL=1
MEFDHDNLYILYGTDEKVIHFSSIVSIKRSKNKKKQTSLESNLFRQVFL